MKITEVVVLTKIKEVNELCTNLLTQNGYKFEDNGISLIIRKEFKSPGFFENIKKIIKIINFNLKLNRFIDIEYSKEDWESAELIRILFPEAWLNDKSFETTCKKCGKKKIEVDTGYQISSFNSNKPIICINGEFTVVNKQTKNKIIQTGYKGALFTAFDKSGNYFHLSARSSITGLIIKEDEVLNYKGICPKCGKHDYDMILGPTRYPKSNWNGDDFVIDEFMGQILVSKKTYDQLKKIDKKIERDEPIFLV